MNMALPINIEYLLGGHGCIMGGQKTALWNSLIARKATSLLSCILPKYRLYNGDIQSVFRQYTNPKNNEWPMCLTAFRYAVSFVVKMLSL